ncbi:hypothetical protein [Burkholderia sp. WAC0059]|uniref:hypothetical protein n=1 Tax=Burkholderia sp. WAC0059 TaxID=2066022 RepID=UPI0011AF8533|nr:hypothetical protein [Burkholderia sp. WAC0059]
MDKKARASVYIDGASRSTSRYRRNDHSISQPFQNAFIPLEKQAPARVTPPFYGTAGLIG